MDIVSDFEKLMDRVGDAINELKYPSVHPTLTKEDLISLLKDVHKFYRYQNVIVNGKDISEIEKRADRAYDSLEDAVHSLKGYKKSHSEDKALLEIYNQVNLAYEDVNQIDKIVEDM